MFVTRGIVSYGIMAEVTGPSYLQVRMYPEIRPEFLSPEFRTKLILPWNDLIPICVPTESGNAAEFRGFWKMTPGMNRNTKRNAHPRSCRANRAGSQRSSLLFSRGSWKQKQWPLLSHIISDHICGAPVLLPFQQLSLSFIPHLLLQKNS